jgi:hypothetical protein
MNERGNLMIATSSRRRYLHCFLNHLLPQRIKGCWGDARQLVRPGSMTDSMALRLPAATCDYA